jgi:signal transduction histidine kinase
VRRQLALVALATTSLVVLALLIPLGRAVQTIPRERALSEAQFISQSLVQTISAVSDKSRLRRLIEQTSSLSTRSISVILPNGELMGASFSPSGAVAAARAGASVQAETERGIEVLTPTVTNGGTAVVRVEVPDSELKRGVYFAWGVLALLGLVLILLAVAISDRLARSIVKPITALATTTSSLEQGNLSARVSPAGPPEVRDVGITLNLLAERISTLVITEREAIADLSHRLRTPITALRLDAEGIQNRSDSDRLVAGVDEVTKAVNDLIRTARAPTQKGASSCDLVSVASQRCAFWSVLATEQGRQFHQRIPNLRARALLDEAELSAAIDILIENIFSHTDDGVSMSLEVHVTRERAEIRVGDGGSGIAGNDEERGLSRSGSTGLGLDIARQSVEQAGGAFLVTRSPLGGALVTLQFPMVVS